MACSHQSIANSGATSQFTGSQERVAAFFDWAAEQGAGRRVGEPIAQRGGQRANPLRLVFDVISWPQPLKSRFRVAGVKGNTRAACTVCSVVDLGDTFGGYQHACFALHAAASILIGMHRCVMRNADQTPLCSRWAARALWMAIRRLVTAAPLHLTITGTPPPVLWPLNQALCSADACIPLHVCKSLSEPASPSLAFQLGMPLAAYRLQPLLICAREEHCVMLHDRTMPQCRPQCNTFAIIVRQRVAGKKPRTAEAHADAAPQRPSGIGNSEWQHILNENDAAGVAAIIYGLSVPGGQSSSSSSTVPGEAARSQHPTKGRKGKPHISRRPAGKYSRINTIMPAEAQTSGLTPPPAAPAPTGLAR